MTTSASIRVLEAATTLFVDVGFEASSIAALSERSGVSNGSIYHHFGSKGAVLDAVLARCAHDLQARLMAVLDAHPDEAYPVVVGTVEAQLAWSETNRPACLLMARYADRFREGETGHDIRALNDRYLQRSRVWLDTAATRGELPALEPELAHAIVFAPARELVRVWLSRPGFPPPTSFAPALAAAAWAGLQATTLTTTHEGALS